MSEEQVISFAQYFKEYEFEDYVHMKDGYRYTTPGQEEKVYEVLKVWKKLRCFTQIRIDYMDAYPSAWYSDADNADAIAGFRLKLLESWATSDNPYKQAVALTELLPEKVLERARWFYNIDFQSFESFLRRIAVHPEQLQGLHETYAAILQEELPPCYTDGWANRIDRWHRPEEFTFDAIIGVNGQRYVTKGSIAHDFFDMGFGFNKYPDTGNDAPVSMSLLDQCKKFVSLKNGANDFVVNQLFGIYAFLYVVLRSNYVWRRNKDVRLGMYFCPGFWITMTSLAIIGFLSPLAAIYVLLGGLVGDSLFTAIPTALIAAITPCIAIIAGVKYVALTCAGYIERKIEASGWDIDIEALVNKEHWEWIGDFLMKMLVGTLGTAAAIVVSVLFYKWFWESFILSFVLTAFAFMYITYMIHEKEFVAPWNADGIRLFSTAVTVFILGRCFIEYAIPVLSKMLAWVWSQIFIVAPTVMLLCVFGAVVCGIMMYDTMERKALWEKDDAALQRLSAFSTWMWRGVLVFAIGIFIYSIAFILLNGGFSSAVSLIGYMLLPALLVTILLLVWFNKYESPDNVQKMRGVARIVDVREWDREKRHFMTNFTSRNPWLFSLPEEEGAAIAKKLYDFMDTYYVTKSDEVYPSKMASPGVIDRIDEFAEFLNGCEMLERREYIHLMLAGYSVKGAECVMNRNPFKESRFYAIFCAPFVVVWKKVVQIFVSLYVIKKILTDYCPVIASERRLD